MELSSILMIVGIIVIILSLFLKDKSVQVEKDVEELSINIYQETNALKRRIKLLEEELLVEPNFQVKHPEVDKPDAFTSFQKVAAQIKTGQSSYTQSDLKSEKNNKPINGILVSQVLALNGQGLSIDEISKLSTLSHAQIQSILANGGKQ